jgi:hypothetical protein
MRLINQEDIMTNQPDASIIRATGGTLALNER